MYYFIHNNHKMKWQVKNKKEVFKIEADLKKDILE